MVAVDDVVGPHVLQVDPLLLEELQSLVHVLQTVDTHSAFGGFRLDVGNRRKRVETQKVTKAGGHHERQRGVQD